MQRIFSLSLLVLITSLSWPANAAEPEIPKCTENYGTLALREPQNQNYWWRQYNLENPEALIKYFVQESGCFTLVDRGEGLEMRGDERALADSGELQVQSNMGKGQVIAADWFLVPDLVARDQNAGGSGLGGVIGGKVGGKLGGLIGGMKTKRLEAETILTLVNARTSVQEITARGEASKTNMKFGGGGLLGAVAAVGGGYGDTDIGRVITAAYAEAYTSMVNSVRQKGAPDASAPVQAYTIAVASEMYKNPSRGERVRKLRSGMVVYPTGQREGAFLEVKDKFGTQGWVSVEDLQ